MGAAGLGEAGGVVEPHGQAAARADLVVFIDPEIQRQRLVDQLPPLGVSLIAMAAPARSGRGLGAPGLVQLGQRQVQAQPERLGRRPQRRHAPAVIALEQRPAQAVFGVFMVQQQHPGRHARRVAVQRELLPQRVFQRRLQPRRDGRPRRLRRQHEVERQRDTPALLHRQHLVTTVGIEREPAEVLRLQVL